MKKNAMRRGNLTVFRHCEAHEQNLKMKRILMRRGNLTVLRHCEVSHNSSVIARRTNRI